MSVPLHGESAAQGGLKKSSDRIVRILDTLACNVMFFIATDGMWSPTGSRVVIEVMV